MLISASPSPIPTRRSCSNKEASASSVGEFSGNEREVIAAPQIAITDHTRFSGNLGAPLVARGGNVAIADSSFDGNKHPSELSQCVTIDIRNTQFTGNSGTEEGGALTVNCDTRIAHSSFANNTSKSGGAIYVGDFAGDLHLTDVDFTGNVASGEGGAIALRFESYAPIPPAQTLELTT